MALLDVTRSVSILFHCRWYRSLCMRRSAEQWRPGAVLVSAQTRVAPYLLRMKWEGFPLHHHAHLGWGYIVPEGLQLGESPDFGEEDDVGCVDVVFSWKPQWLLWNCGGCYGYRCFIMKCVLCTLVRVLTM